MAIQDSMRTTRLHFMTLRGLLYDTRWLANFTESSSWSNPRRVIVSLSRPCRVNRVSPSHPRVVMVPYWVILAETSSPRRVLEWSWVVLVECWSIAWKFEGLFIKSNLSLNNFKWLLTKLELSSVRNIIPRSRKHIWNGYPFLNQEL